MTEFLIAIVLTMISHATHARMGLDLADEGSLWNGVLRTRRGDIPVRHFRAYDPGRYYWCWAWMTLFGFGIMGLRHSVAVFGFLGLWAGLVAISTVTDNVWELAGAGLICVLWMHPRHKLFEHALSLFAICVVTYSIQNPSPAMFFAAGIYTGFAAFMGRNHGVWVLAAILSLFLVMGIKGETENIVWNFGKWAGGIVVGYSPMLFMWAVLPGMFRRFWYNQVIVFLFVKRGRGGMPLPIPWPWKDSYTQPRRRDRLTRFLVGVHFVALPLFYGAVIVWIAAAPAALENPLLVASCLVGIFYAHHAWRRADLPHLCQVMQPFLLGVFAATFAQQIPLLSALTIAVLTVVALSSTRGINPLIRKTENSKDFTKYDVNGDALWIPKVQARFLSKVRDLVAGSMRPGDAIFIAPLSPGLYPILQAETPIRSDFLLHRETEQVQREAIRDMEKNNVNWALIQDFKLDRREDLRFKNSHAVMWDYFCTHFDESEHDLGSAWSFLKRRDDAPNDGVRT